MLNTINFTTHRIESGFADYGKLAEALLFYREVNLFVKAGNLLSLLNDLSIESLLALIEEFNLNIYYVETHLQIVSKIKGQHTKIGVLRSTPDMSVNEIVRNALINRYDSNKKTKEIIDRVIKRITIVRFKEDFTNKILSDYLDKEYLNNSIKKLNITLSGPKNISELEVTRDSDSSYIFKDIHILPTSRINDDIGALDSLNFLLEAREQIELGASLNSEILTQESISKVIQVYFNRFAKKTSNFKIYQEFQNIFVNDVPSISEVINDSPDLINEYLKILRKSHKFRDWLDSQEKDSDILSEYYKKVTEKSIFEKGPIKQLKWVVDIGASTLLGFVNIGAGLVYSGFSGFVENKINNNWKPNMFIDTKLKRFLKQ